MPSLCGLSDHISVCLHPAPFIPALRYEHTHLYLVFLLFVLFFSMYLYYIYVWVSIRGPHRVAALHCPYLLSGSAHCIFVVFFSFVWGLVDCRTEQPSGINNLNLRAWVICVCKWLSLGKKWIERTNSKTSMTYENNMEYRNKIKSIPIKYLTSASA